MKIKINGAVIFTSVIAGVLVVALMSSWHWSFATRLFPWVITIPTLVLCLIQLLLDLRRAQSLAAEEDTTGIMDLAVDRGVALHLVVRRAANIFGWVFGLFAMIWLVGFIISSPLFIWLYLTFQAREKWWVTATWIVLTLVFLLGLFHYILHVPWPEGAIPWPQEKVLEWIGG
jgi:hypothetical protein